MVVKLKFIKLCVYFDLTFFYMSSLIKIPLETYVFTEWKY